MEKNSFFLTKNFKIILFSLAALIILLFAFRCGISVGRRQADFSYRWGENYHKNFGGPRGGFMQGPMERDFISGHGNVGEIIKIENNSIIIKDPAGIEKIINQTPETTLRLGRETINNTQLKIGDRIIIIGSPKDDGTIDAKFIRAFNEEDLPERLPPPPGFGPSLRF